MPRLNEQITLHNETISQYEEARFRQLEETIALMQEELRSNPRFNEQLSDSAEVAEQFGLQARKLLKGLIGANSQEQYLLYQNGFSRLLDSYRELAHHSRITQHSEAFTTPFANLCRRVDQTHHIFTDQDREHQAYALVDTIINSQEAEQGSVTSAQVEDAIIRLQKILSNHSSQQRGKALLSELSSCFAVFNSDDGEYRNNLSQTRLSLKRKENYQPASEWRLVQLLKLAAAQSQFLQDARFSYLNKTSSGRGLLTDLGFITVGVAVVATASILAIAAPYLLIPGIVIGTMAHAYGLINFSRASVNMLQELVMPQLGDREAIEERLNFSAEERQQLQQQRAEQQTSRRRFMAVGTITAGLSSAIAIIGVLSLVPGIAFPPLLGLSLAIASLTLITASVATFGAKLYAQQKSDKTAQTKVSDIEQDFQQHLSEQIQRAPVDSTAAVISHDKPVDQRQLMSLQAQLRDRQFDPDPEPPSPSLLKPKPAPSKGVVSDSDSDKHDYQPPSHHGP